MNRPSFEFYPVATFWMVAAIIGFIISNLIFNGAWIGALIGFIVLAVAGVLALVAVHHHKH